MMPYLRTAGVLKIDDAQTFELGRDAAVLLDRKYASACTRTFKTGHDAMPSDSKYAKTCTGVSSKQAMILFLATAGA